MNDSEPQNIKCSVRDKYKRRLQWLAHTVQQYEIAASERIDHEGKIRDRAEIEAILKVLVPLKKYLSCESELDEETTSECANYLISNMPRLIKMHNPGFNRLVQETARAG